MIGVYHDSKFFLIAPVLIEHFFEILKIDQFVLLSDHEKSRNLDDFNFLYRFVIPQYIKSQNIFDRKFQWDKGQFAEKSIDVLMIDHDLFNDVGRRGETRIYYDCLYHCVF